ncbi:uncharacterized protein E5676_scaffold315G001100 [Cucumis melo var. makuwa]|uniref:Uncharacterized protein n=1 Tax=Cucumis melo var. makuwa TaxID=1194695 RepID=A0A5D3CGZ4_CUCMM|nr:uncharacterized protein E6C27_scaffold125G00170 [Cucumis melo var. makuwa]TYK10630.1 uncharacterized protein E5676_scaffold315G001100 [Cucumis melo var. makuwa]
MVLQFADRSISPPEGKIEDVLVKVDKFLFPTRFVILDYEADQKLNDQEVTFNIVNAMKFPSDAKNYKAIESLRKFEPLDLQTKGDRKNKPSIEKPPELELKSLPYRLKYAYLGKNNTLSVIIST